LIWIIEAVLPWFAVIIALAPPVCQVLILSSPRSTASDFLFFFFISPQVVCPRFWLYPMLTLITCVWLRWALVPPALHPFGVIASEFPAHPVIGHIALGCVARSQGLHWPADGTESGVLGACIGLNALVCIYLAYVFCTGQLTARRELGKALEEAGFEPSNGYPQGVSTEYCY